MNKLLYEAFKSLEEVEDIELNENFKVFYNSKKSKKLNESVENKKEIKEELVEDKDAFWKMRDTISSVSGDKYDEVNLILDGEKIRPLEKKELANKFAVSVEHADEKDFKTREEIEQIAKDNNVEKIMFFVFKGQYGGEYSFLVKDEEVAKKIAEEYKQKAYGKYDKDGEYEEILLKQEEVEEELDEEKHICEKCGKEVCECNKVEEAKEDDNVIRRAGKVRRGRELKKEALTEARFDLSDDEEVEEAKELLDVKERNVEQIVDIDANTVEELKQSYLGNAILQCPICKTTQFRKLDEIKKSEDELKQDLYNVGEACPHCGAEDGYKLVGQVANMNVDVEGEKERTGKEDIKAEEEKVEFNKQDLPELEEMGEEEIKFESLQEEEFDKQFNKFLNEKYQNVDSYKSIDGKIDKDNNFILEGILTYKSGKREKLTINFRPQDLLVEGKLDNVVFNGVCEKFSKDSVFTLTGKICEKELNCVSLNINL